MQQIKQRKRLALILEMNLNYFQKVIEDGIAVLIHDVLVVGKRIYPISRQANLVLSHTANLMK